ncbi:MAG: cation:proton antiporter [Deltaproteobacteria bacterium]|nr:cation:proton antiporter [Deltaproteobacteria bacterium]
MTLIYIWFVALALGIVLSVVRSLLGPTSPDRVAAVDVMTTIVSGLMIIIAMVHKSSILIDVSLVYSILSFITVMAVARYLERGV